MDDTTSRDTPLASIASSTLREPATLLAKYIDGAAIELGRVSIGGEMHDRVDAMFLHRSGEGFRILDGCFDQGSPTHRPAIAAPQIVIDDRNQAVPRQGLAGVASDVAGAAGDEHPHDQPCPRALASKVSMELSSSIGIRPFQCRP